MTAFSSKAGHMLGGGYSPAPLRPDTGLPILKKWDELRTRTLSLASIATIIRQNPNAGLAVVCGYRGLCAIDVDTDDPAIIDIVCSVLPAPVVVRRGSKGFVVFYRSEVDIAGKKFVPPGKDARPLVEVLAKGVVTIPPSQHRKTHKPYRWETKATLFNTRVDQLSTITPAHIEALAKALAPWCPVKPAYVASLVISRDIPVSDKRMQAWASKVLANEVSYLSRLVSGRNVALFNAMCKLARYVHHGALSKCEVEAALMGVSKANGYIAAHGAAAALGTVQSGLKKGLGDALPVLQDKPWTPRHRPVERQEVRP